MRCIFLARYQSKSGETSDLAYCCQTQQANERTEKMSHSFFHQTNDRRAMKEIHCALDN